MELEKLLLSVSFSASDGGVMKVGFKYYFLTSVSSNVSGCSLRGESSGDC